MKRLVEPANRRFVSFDEAEAEAESNPELTHPRAIFRETPRGAVGSRSLLTDQSNAGGGAAGEHVGVGADALGGGVSNRALGSVERVVID